MSRLAFVLTLLGSVATAAAQATEQPPSPPPGDPVVPQSTLAPSASLGAPPPPPAEKTKEPKAGDFNAGGQARFPSGPDNMGEYANFNWVAFDLKGRYYLLKTVTVDANIPLAVKKPDAPMVGGAVIDDPSLFGGGTLTLDARLPIPKGKLPLLNYDVDIGIALTLGYMREGAMLLSEKDFPLFVGGMKPGTAGGLIVKTTLSSLLAFSFVPTYVFQSGETESQTALQIPMALEVGLGSLLRLYLELGIYTGDDISLSGDNGGRIPVGAALDIKLGPILLHTGAGLASLLTGPLYPTRTDSFYVDLNVKYVK